MPERRHWKRFVTREVSARFKGYGQGSVCNLSEGGLLVLLDREVDPGVSGNLIVDLPGRQFEASGKVVYVGPDFREELYRTGIAFETPTGGQLETLRGFLREQLDRQSSTPPAT